MKKRYHTFIKDKDGKRGVKEMSIAPAEAAKRKAEKQAAKKNTKPKGDKS